MLGELTEPDLGGLVERRGSGSHYRQEHVFANEANKGLRGNKVIEKLREFHRRTGASHFASSASVLPILQAIKERMKPEDVCLLSKAHATTAYNLVFGVPMEDAPVQGEFGSLGSALPFALGVAKMKPESTVHVVVGDGEMQEGSCWEAIHAMGRLGIDNIRIHVDNNKMQGMGNTPGLRYHYINIHNTVKGESWECHYANA
jgi:transketolase N-terminal domain/subunit